MSGVARRCHLPCRVVFGDVQTSEVFNVQWCSVVFGIAVLVFSDVKCSKVFSVQWRSVLGGVLCQVMFTSLTQLYSVFSACSARCSAVFDTHRCCSAVLMLAVSVLSSFQCSMLFSSQRCLHSEVFSVQWCSLFCGVRLYLSAVFRDDERCPP